MNQILGAIHRHGRYSAEAEQAFATLDEMVADAAAEVRGWRGWQLLMAPELFAEFRALLREIMLSVHMYQGFTTEAGFRMIGRLPKNETRLMQVLSHHKAEEAEHGLWAWEDYLALGGDPSQSKIPASDAAFSVAAVWGRMADVCDPFGYLGAEYLFENLTERLTKDVTAILSARGASMDGFRFIVNHAVEDERHSNLFRHLIKRTLTERPDTLPDMLRCFGLFHQVYPLPLWEEALRRAGGREWGPL